MARAQSHSWMLYVYLLASKIMAPIAKRHLAKRVTRGKESPDRYQEKMGVTNIVRPKGKLIWLHAVGVGEALALPTLISAINKRDKNLSFLITTSVRAASDALAPNLPQNTIHQYLPLDCKPFVHRFLDHWQPDLSVWAERDIWPALIHETHQRGIPMAIVNGKMNAQSLDSKKRAKNLFRFIYNLFDFIAVQDDESEQHFRRIGVEAQKVSVSGSLKSSGPALFVDPTEFSIWRDYFENRFVWVAASTHAPEEEFAIEAHQEVLKQHPDAALIIAPRDITRRSLLLDEFQDSVCEISAVDTPPPSNAIYLHAQIGYLGLWYKIAQSAFIGGSISEIGGHNPYEAARLDCKIIHGPNTQNFVDDYDRFTKAKLANCVSTPSELAQAVIQSVTDAELSAAKALADHGQIALDALADRLLNLMN